MSDDLLSVSVGSGRNSKNWKVLQVEWDWFVDKCSNPKITHETYKQYMAMEPDRQDEIKDVGGFVAGYLNGRRRKKHAMVSRSVLTLDADFAGPRFWKDFTTLYKCQALMYSTHKHCPDKPRYRLLIPLSRDVDVAEYEPLSRWVCGDLGIDQFDRTTHAVERLMYFPSVSTDGEFVFKEQNGKFLDVDKILAHYKDWRNAAEWPFGEMETKQIRTGMKLAGNPLEKPGVIGAFNRTYTIPAVIEEYLADVYTQAWVGGDQDYRYTYSEGTTTGGLVVYDEMWTYSHHGSDPTSERLCNAFDLVRIHKFGYMDDHVKEDTPINKLPSFAAMSELATTDKEVRILIGEEKQALARNAFNRVEEEGQPNNNRTERTAGDTEPVLREKKDKKASVGPGAGAGGGDTEWWGELDTDKRGVYHPTHKNYELILDNDPGLSGRIGLNLFAGRTEIIGGLPWDEEKNNRGWESGDESMLYWYIGLPPYEMQRTPKMKDALEAIKRRNAFHPVKDFLLSTPWDGANRIDTAIIDFLGAEDTRYIRAVTRKWFIAGVARIFQPGIKFDEVLTLVGPERRGKSYFVSCLGGKWFTDAFKFSQLNGGNGKQAFESTQGAWIVEIGEMAGMGKVAVEDAKSFLSSQVDKFRPSHKEDTVERPRCWIPMGTTNNYGFMQGAFGNGRFWPVDTHINAPKYDLFKELDAAYVSQLWAEAVEAYRSKEVLFLSDEIKKDALKVQIDHEEVTGLEGVLLDYLNMELSENWKNMDAHSRHLYFKSKRQETGIYHKKVCVAQIWCEAFGRDIVDIKKYNSIEINTMMRKMKNWNEYRKTTYFSVYGEQRGYFYEEK